MKQVGILDSAFINLEQPDTPQHIGTLGIYDPSAAPGGSVCLKKVIATFERRLNQQPLFRTRLVDVPGGLDRSYWVEDASFNVDFHFRQIALPKPGGWRELRTQVAHLHSRPLDLSRPLWELYVIEGLDSVSNLPAGSFAVYTKMHHAMIDGTGASNLMTLLHDTVANPDTEDEPERVSGPFDSEPLPSELLSKASRNYINNTRTLAAGAVKSTRDMGKYALQIARKEIPAPDISAPKTLLNKPVGPHRVFDAAEFPLEDFNRIKVAAGVKLNDVALAVIGGGLQRYLEAKGEQPEGSLSATMPLNMRTRRAVTDDNNQVGSIFASLHSNEKDPLARLAAVHKSSMGAKEHGAASPMVDVLKVAGVFNPVIAKTVAGFWSRNSLSSRLPVNISTVVSNVAGPESPLYFAGARLADYYVLGVLTPGVGVFHLVFSYSGRLTLSVLADRDIMPDPEFYHDCLVASYEELLVVSCGLKKSARTPKAKPANKAKAKVTPNTITPKPKVVRRKQPAGDGSSQHKQFRRKTQTTRRQAL
jgi:diacylglycerol O-acyltransferase